MSDNTKDRPLYVISVAAELVGMHPQTLRLYDREGLVSPYHQPGQGKGKSGRERKTRLYSQHDIEKLIYIKYLTQEMKVSLEGVKEITKLQRELEVQQLELDQRKRELEQQKTRMQMEIARLRGQISTLEDQTGHI